MAALQVHYALHFNGDLHHIELEPNYGLLSPAMVVESKRNDVRNSKFTPPKPQQCHFVGIIRGHRNSRAAISLCEGMLKLYSPAPLGPDKNQTTELVWTMEFDSQKSFIYPLRRPKFAILR
ncbi:unnamed protein product [Timema podura]|uniref:Peptidase M12B propeptide domain-containing protein n=1 Tax=Timema podura TaxID=61482 RepID=A0ABN7PGD2_TIMPD|nr:unnamed protein product [Timema podura]